MQNHQTLREGSKQTLQPGAEPGFYLMPKTPIKKNLKHLTLSDLKVDAL